MASDADADYADTYTLDGGSVEPMVSWGINPGQAVGVSAEAPARLGRPRVGPGRAQKGLRPHRIQGRGARRGASRGRGVHRVLHQRKDQRPARGGAGGQGQEGVFTGESPGGPRLPSRASTGGGGRPAGDLPRGRLRVAGRRLLHVPCHEPRQAERPPGLRKLVQQELHRPPGVPARAERSS